MKLPRRQLLRLAGAAIAAPIIRSASSARAEGGPLQVDKLDIKRQEVQQSADAKGAFFGQVEDGNDNPAGPTLSWHIRGGALHDIAWQLADVGVGVFRRPNPNIAPLDVTFRCTIWSRGYESTMARNGGCYLEVVLSNKDGLTLNHVPLLLAGFDIRCQFKGNNVVLPSLSYLPLNNAMFDEISHIQLFDWGGSAHQDVPYIRAFACSDK